MAGQEDYKGQRELHTPDWLRTFKGCEHYTDEEASAILYSLDILAEIFLTVGGCDKSKMNSANIIPLYNNVNVKAA